MPIISGCTWIQQNTRVINREINNAHLINASLVLDKFVIWKSFDFDAKPEERLDKKGHFMMVKKVSDGKSFFTPTNYNQLKQRRYILNNVVTFHLTTQTRVIVNHGGESILDNSIALHPYYGFPVIPGTAIKGVTRHYCKEFLKLHKTDRLLYLRLFGNEPEDQDAEEGEIIFYDGWPERQIDFLEIDVFTPHYQRYYEGNTLPGDNQNPVPIPFLAIKRGVSFELAVSPSSNYKGGDINKLLEQVKIFIIGALKTFGIGAKTGSNYGYFG